MFPLSNWTELDIWQYILEEEIPLPPIYFAHRRQVFRRDGMLLAVNPYTPLNPGEEPFEALVRFRTVGDATCTGCVESSAATPEEEVAEVAGGTRLDRARRQGRRSRRPHQRSRHGGPEEDGVRALLDVRAAAVRHRRVRSTTGSRP